MVAILEITKTMTMINGTDYRLLVNNKSMSHEVYSVLTNTEKLTILCLYDTDVLPMNYWDMLKYYDEEKKLDVELSNNKEIHFKAKMKVSKVAFITQVEEAVMYKVVFECIT